MDDGYVLGMTIKQTLTYVRTNYPTISIQWKGDTREYRVTYKRAIVLSAQDAENKAAYCTDSDDAIGTAKFMHESWGK